MKFRLLFLVFFSDSRPKIIGTLRGTSDTECAEKFVTKVPAPHTVFFLEIFVRKFKGGNQPVLVQNWVKIVGINKWSLSKNLKNGPKRQL